MSGGIFLIKDDDELVKMDEKAYDSEAVLQELLAKYPDLLAGDQINKDDPRRWLLVRREMGVPNEKGGDHWSIDHLFLDQEGIPTLVEVKRSTDLRIRREVVGQMLDYAANAVAYWPVERIKNEFENYCTANGEDPEQKMADFLAGDMEPELFWQNVKTNLQAQKIRMVFIADAIPSELRRIVEFLNEQMDPAEVLAIEVKLFMGNGLRSLVPRVIGQSEEALQKRAASAKKPKLDKTTFLNNVDEFGKQFYADLISFSEKNKLPLHWGVSGFSMNVEVQGQDIPIVFAYSRIAFSQNIYTSNYYILKYINNGEEIALDFDKQIEGLGIFEKYASGLKCPTNRKIDKETKEKLFAIVLSIAERIKKFGLKE